MLDIVGHRKWWYLISLLALVPGLISLAIYRLEPSIDFTGGTVWEIRTPGTPDVDRVRAILDDNGFGDAIVQEADEDVVIIRMRELREGSEEKEAITAAFNESFGSFEELQLQTVGPSVGEETRNRAIVAVVLAAIGVLLYIAWAFRKTENPMLYGVAAIIAMLHDVLFVLGVFSILGVVADVEVDALFVTAVLTVMGFSVHDTIVVFDRIRENLARKTAPTYEETVNYSVVQTIVRSVNTSITVILTLLALYLFGGESTRWFVFALLIGVLAGTYSSIFNAAQMLVSWKSGEVHRFLRLGGGGRSNTSTSSSRTA